jgi:hypothetical protein
MAEPRVVVRGGVERAKGRPMPVEVAWSALRILGVVFIVAGGIDLALLWYPARFGLAEFEFATISSFVAGLPVLTTGLVVLAVVAVGTGNRGLQLVIGLAAAGILALLAVLVVLFALTVPVALAARITDPAIRIGVRKSIVKTTVQFMAYGLGYLALTWKLIRAWRMTK